MKSNRAKRYILAGVVCAAVFLFLLQKYCNVLHLPTSGVTEEKSSPATFVLTEGKTLVEGKIVARSILPDPGESDYPDCWFTAYFIGNAICSGEPCPREISLVFEGFSNYESLYPDELQPGDEVECLVMPFDRLPAEAQSTQVADDLNLYMLKSYYVAGVRKIWHYRNHELMPSSGVFFSDRTVEVESIFDLHINEPIPQDVRTEQERSIRQDLIKMESLLKGYDDAKIEELNGRFQAAWEKEKAKDAPGHNRVTRNGRTYVWRNVDNSFWCLPEDYTFLSGPDTLTRETLDCFTALKDACEANGIQLIVSLVPDLYVIASRVMNRDFRDVPDLQSAAYAKQLSEIGVETVYASGEIVKNYNRHPFAFLYPADIHPGDTTQDVITDILADRLKRYHFKQKMDPSLFSCRTVPIKHSNNQNLFPSDCDIGDNPAGDSYPGEKVCYNEKTISRNPDSSILIIGNSFIQTPVISSESFPSFLTMKTASPADWYSVFGYGLFSEVLIRLMPNIHSLFQQKKVMIMLFGTNQLCRVNRDSFMLNIRELDSNLLLLNGKQCRMHVLPPGGEEIDLSEWKEPMPGLETENLFRIGEQGTIEYSVSLPPAGNGDYDSGKPAVCIVPAVSPKETSVDFCVNGRKKHMHSLDNMDYPRYFNLFFELPAGTTEITIRAEGKPGTVFAIRDIQIWQ